MRTCMHKVPIALFPCFFMYLLLLGNTAYGKWNRFEASKGYCTWYAAEEFNKIAPDPGVDWRGDAWEWFENARGWAKSKQPMSAEKGAIIVWGEYKDKGKKENVYGHVGIVENVDCNSNTITVSEMNWGKFYSVTTNTLSLHNLDRGKILF